VAPEAPPKMAPFQTTVTRAAYKETSLDIALDLKPVFGPDGKFRSIRKTSNGKIADAWLYSSWADGIEQLQLPLLRKDDSPANYRVKLYFAKSGIETGDLGPIVFDVLMQGKVVLESVTLNPSAGEELEVVMKEVPSVAVTDNLIIDFKAKVGVAHSAHRCVKPVRAGKRRNRQ
jgi:hypothetical protein